ncbi:hypothetical protein N7474_008524 [Penicillium riverlandense]|uniref:uncharacterized protein n=1 Tax=Penicillium riverlandense TaxID=1903569 RepID=UPI002546A391|nr:uncharacterized protein N7474_008524 [Penicillium riverlandense]KAJ5812223.1 hypothetical protein N7474_008524 [Penicillium riverlandense]
MPRFNSPVDNAQLFYRDYKPVTTSTIDSQSVSPSNPAILFIHGWPYSSLMWDDIAVPLCKFHNFRCIAPDRRGFGKSDWNGPRSDGNITYNTFAQDTNYLVEDVLNLGPFVVVALSMGPGESILAFDANEYFRQNCKGFVWVASDFSGNSRKTDKELAEHEAVWKSILDGLATSRAEYTHSALPGVIVGSSQYHLAPETLAHYERIVSDADALAIQGCARAIRLVDFSEKLRRIGKDYSTPILCIHGDSDTGSPYETTAKVMKEIVPRARVKIYEQGAHALQVTHREQLVEDILEFVRNLSSC